MENLNTTPENLTEKDLELIKKFNDEPLNNSKFMSKSLKKIATKVWTQDIVDYIFDPQDTCHCSLSMRKLYKEKFYIKWNELITLANSIL